MADIKAYRLAHGLSLLEMSQMLGLSKSMVSMIENGHRDLPAAAARKFHSIQENHPGNRHPVVPSEDFFQLWKDKHDKLSAEYLKTYQGDCQAELHKLTKQLKALKERFLKVEVNVRHLGSMIEMHQKNPLPVQEIIIMNEKILVMESEFQFIAAQRPEIIQLKIDGLEQQLRSIKPMLGKQKKLIKN